MKLSEDQKRLIALLKTLGLQEEGIIMTMLAVKEPEKTYKLLEYVADMTNKALYSMDNIKNRQHYLGNISKRDFQNT